MYSRWLQDITDSQAPSGQLPEVAPGPVLDDGYNGAWWGGMGVFGPWLLYSFSGDTAPLARHYPAMRAYTLFLNASAKTDGSSDVPWGLGDWLSLLPSCAQDSAAINTPALAFYAHVVSQAAQLLGAEGGDAALFSSLSAAVSAAYLARRLNASSGAVGAGQQCTQALALGLYADFLPAQHRPAVEAALLARIASDGTALTTGFVTFTRMLQVLADLDPASGLGILLQRAALGPWSNSAGSSNDLCKEQWDGGDAQMPSLCGPLALWSFSALAGLRLPPFLAPSASSSPAQYPASSSAGLAVLVIKPAVGVLGLRWVSASVTLPAGVATVAWYLDDSAQQLKLLVVLPPGTSAVVHMPAVLGSVTESGRPAAEAPGVQVLGQFGKFALLQVQSGAYAFAGATDT
jgi:alpha-L-rhamnosidase